MVSDGLFTCLIGSLLKVAKAPPTGGESREVALDAGRLRRVLDHVEAHLASTITVEDMAATACMSPAHFSRRFRLAVGKSPHAFVLSRRIALACRRLARSEEGLAAIALDCGFSGQSHFTQRFRAQTGMTPAAYRKDLRA